MKLINRIVSRYRSLPPVSLLNKFKFAILRGLYKSLIRQAIIDTDCSLKITRYAKGTTCQLGGHSKIICLSGFGWSGSGAVKDLLKEYDNVSVTFTMEGRPDLEFGPEIDLFRTVGGLFDLERAFDDGNIFLRDAAVRLFLVRVKDLYINTKGMYNDNFIRITKDFLNEIIEFKSPSCGEYGFSNHISGLGRFAEELFFGHCDEQRASGYVFYLKDISRDEFRDIAKKYVDRVLRTLPSKDVLVLDQPFSDYEANIKRYQDYIGPMKMIAVYRDPRDVYAMKLIHPEIDWIPLDPNNFISWYRKCHVKSLKSCHPDFMMMKFSDLVLHYDESVKRIEEFCGLNSALHTMPQKRFDPSVSIKNIGIYKPYSNTHAIKQIEFELGDFLQ